MPRLTSCYIVTLTKTKKTSYWYVNLTGLKRISHKVSTSVPTMLSDTKMYCEIIEFKLWFENYTFVVSKLEEIQAKLINYANSGYAINKNVSRMTGDSKFLYNLIISYMTGI